MVELEETTLTVDEFEALRLKDLNGVEQEEAAQKMGISQPTFNRLTHIRRPSCRSSQVGCDPSSCLFDFNC